MSLVLPDMYHWSPIEARAGILRRGLLPRTYTAIASHPWKPGEVKDGHYLTDIVDETVRAVCLSATARTAWCYSGALNAERGSVWDLWEVRLASDDDEIHVQPFLGYIMNEVRVVNRIPKSRVWHVATRTVGARKVKGNPV